LGSSKNEITPAINMQRILRNIRFLSIFKICNHLFLDF